MVYRVFVEKKQGFTHEADGIFNDATSLLKIKDLTKVRVFNRYDAENIDEELFSYAIKTVFSEPQLDDTYFNLDIEDALVFAVEYLPGQYDQRADSASQCIQIISQGERPTIKTAKVYAFYGINEEQLQVIKKYIINPVESREASLELPKTLKIEYEIPSEVEVLQGFIDLDQKGLEDFIKKNGLAMDLGDITFCQNYFKGENRNPTITEIKMIDTYWSDHCRHTTFLTIIDKVSFEDKILQDAYEDYINLRKSLNRTKPICLMDLATIAVKHLKKTGKLDKLDESEEINACTVKIEVETDGKKEQKCNKEICNL